MVHGVGSLCPSCANEWCGTCPSTHALDIIIPSDNVGSWERVTHCLLRPVINALGLSHVILDFILKGPLPLIKRHPPPPLSPPTYQLWKSVLVNLLLAGVELRHRRTRVFALYPTVVPGALWIFKTLMWTPNEPHNVNCYVMSREWNLSFWIFGMGVRCMDDHGLPPSTVGAAWHLHWNAVGLINHWIKLSGLMRCSSKRLGFGIWGIFVGSRVGGP